MKKNKERKKMEKPFSNLISYYSKESSVIIIQKEIMNELMVLGMIKSMTKQSLNNDFYEVMGTDIGLLYLGSNRYKIMAVEDINMLCADFSFNLYNGKVKSYIPKRFGYDKDEEELEVIIVYYKQYGRLIPGIREKISPHHKWFRFCCLPEMISVYSYDDHQMLHNLFGRYSHNQVIEITHMKQFIFLINEIIKIRGKIKNNKFSISF